MSLRSFVISFVFFKVWCMVIMGNSSSVRVTRDEAFYSDSTVADVSIACIKAHLKSGTPAREFMILENEEPTCDDTITEAQKMCNKEKNRYVNILPCDSTRVRLAPIAGIDGSDYINANFIDGDGTERAYIATQGPLMHTRGDFWRMVWENNSTIVVMLGKEKENDRVKVDRYWPEEGEPPLQLHNLQVSLNEKIYEAELNIAVRKLHLIYTPPHAHDGRGGNTVSRVVMHYQYEGWPDHGVPPSATPIRHLVHIIEQEKLRNPIQHPSPMIVHCSAGVGRTGTFVTIHMIILQIFRELQDGNRTLQQQHQLSHSTNSIPSKPSNTTVTIRFNLYNTVLKLRRQRPGMVQQQEQYAFCYEAVAEEAEQLGLIPSSPVVQKARLSRTLSVSTSALPSPSMPSANLRTSSSSYVSSPTTAPPPPNFFEFSNVPPSALETSTQTTSSSSSLHTSSETIREKGSL